MSSWNLMRQDSASDKCCVSWIVLWIEGIWPKPRKSLYAIHWDFGNEEVQGIFDWSVFSVDPDRHNRRQFRTGSEAWPSTPAKEHACDSAKVDEDCSTDAGRLHRR